MENLRNKECIIFDFDKTIGNVIADWEIWRKELYKIIKRYDPEFIGSVETVRLHKENDYSEKYGENFAKEMLVGLENFEQNNILDVIANEPVISLIKSLADKKLFIWTSNTLVGIKEYLKKFGLQNSFEKIVTMSDVRYEKPNPEGFSLIKEKNHPLSSYVLIGDSLSDKGAAELAGIDFINVDQL